VQPKNSGLRARGASDVWAVIAGGGTGGHLYPGLAVASELVKLGHDPSSLHFVGARRGLEAKITALEGFPSTLLPGHGLRRSASLASALGNAKALAGSTAAVAIAVRLFGSWRPSVLMSLGGYASLPCVIAAMVWRVPIVIVNVDAVPGLANRLAARVARVCAVGAPGVDLPRAVFTGVPVRGAVAAIDRGLAARRQARERLGLPADALVVAVSGGSLGSLRINEATFELAERWRDRADVAIRHVVGRRDWPELGNRALRSGALVYQRVPYEEDMASLYSAADVAVQRAGANTVAELAVAGVPSVLVALPGSPGDHQGANARAMAGAGGAVVVADSELDGERLERELAVLLGDPGALARMGEAARALGRPGAASEVARLVEDHALRRHGEVGARGN